MRKFWKEFKEFINRGNVVDLAVAVIIGGAFGKIVTSLVNDIITPLIGIMIGNISLSDLKWVIKKGTETTNELAINYGNFLQTMFDFLIIALCVFIVIKIFMASKRRLEEATNKVVDEIKKLTRKERKKLLKENAAKESENTTKEEKVIENEPIKKVEVENQNEKINQPEIVKEETNIDILKEIRDLLKQK